MSYREFLSAGAGASALIVCLLIWARAPGAYTKISLLAFIRRWARLSAGTAAAVVFGVGVATALLVVGAIQETASSATVRVASYNDDDATDDPSIEGLRAYVDQLPKSAHQNQTPMPAAREDLPDVDTMISRLANRLENDKTDKDGWRTLGWAYLNTEKYADAVKAYEVALALDPTNAEVKSSLEEARSKIAKPESTSAPVTAAQQAN
jgi:cytochrome c-type biogenesis protein CcmH